MQELEEIRDIKISVFVQICSKTAAEKEYLDGSHRFLYNYQSHTEKFMFFIRLNGKFQDKYIFLWESQNDFRIIKRDAFENPEENKEFMNYLLAANVKKE